MPPEWVVATVGPRDRETTSAHHGAGRCVVLSGVGKLYGCVGTLDRVRAVQRRARCSYGWRLWPQREREFSGPSGKRHAAEGTETERVPRAGSERKEWESEWRPGTSYLLENLGRGRPMTASLCLWEVPELMLLDRFKAPPLVTGGARDWDRMGRNGPRLPGGAAAGVELRRPPSSRNKGPGVEGGTGGPLGRAPMGVSMGPVLGL